MLIKYLSIAYYFNNNAVYRGKLARYISSKIVAKQVSKALASHTLHFGTYGFSQVKLPKNHSHYLYIDSTWDLMSGQTAFIDKFSERLIKDVEFVEAESYKRFKHIFTISEYVKRNLISKYQVAESDITVVGTGVGIIKPYFGEKNYNNGKILFVAKGRFEDKGGDLVIQGFKKALENNPNLELSIVGQSSYEKIEKHPKIETYGFLPLHELQHMFETHSLFLMPATYEPWGLVYIEALFCKMPIVGLNRNSFPEISNYGKFGFGLNERDENLLAQTINYAFANPLLLKKMGEEAQEYCLSHFTWDKGVDIILDKISSLDINTV